MQAAYQRLDLALPERNALFYTRFFAMNDSGTPQEPAPARPIDHDAMRAVVGGDDTLLLEISELFLEDLPGMVERLREAAGGEDPRALWKSAHTLKGAAANFGAHRVVALAQELERAVDAGEQMAELREPAQELEREVEHVAAALCAMCARLRAG